MKGIDIFRQIEQIDDKYVAEAQMVRKRAWKNPRVYGSMTATACLLLCIGVYFQMIGNTKDSTEMMVADEYYRTGNGMKDAMPESAMEDGAVGEAAMNETVMEAADCDDVVNNNYYSAVTEEELSFTEDKAMSDKGDSCEELTYENALSEPDFGAYVKLDVPTTFSNTTCFLTGKEDNKRLHILWDDGGMRYIQCDYTILQEVESEDTVNRTEYSVFDASEISLELIQQQAYRVQDAGDVEGDRMHFGICFNENVLLELKIKGLDSETVYQMLLPLL